MWRQLEEQGRIVRLEETKTGPRAIYLGAPAANLVASMPRLAGEPHIFPSPAKPGQPIGQLQGIWARVRSGAELVDGVRLYDACRHTFTTTALEMGVPLDRVQAIVGHVVTASGVTARYVHVRPETLLRHSDEVARKIQELLAGG